MSPPVIKILDGGLGTALEDKYHTTFDASKPLWSSHLLLEDDPKTLLSCQRDFAAAGADVLLTATYQVSIEGFARTRTAKLPDGVPREAAGTYLRRAVDIARRAGNEGAAMRSGNGEEGVEIGLSLGPYGACMVPAGQEYSGRYDAEHSSEQALFAWHLERLRLFGAVGGLMEGLRYVAFETVPRADEVRAIRRAVAAAGKEGIRSKEFWICCVFPEGVGAIPDGTRVEEVVGALLGGGGGGDGEMAVPWGIGVNCTKIDKLAAVVEAYGEAVAGMVSREEIREAPALVLYPDGTRGEVYNTVTKTWDMPEDATGGRGRDTRSWAIQLAQIVEDAKSKGVFSSFVVGGCCKASAADIKELRGLLK